MDPEMEWPSGQAPTPGPSGTNTPLSEQLPYLHAAIESASDEQPSGEILSDGDDQSVSTTLQSKAIELYGHILLGRAHFLFFNSIYEKDIEHQARVLLEEAVKRSTSDRLCAKLWFVRGFGADTRRDPLNARRCFVEAVELDSEYRTLERVDHYLAGQHHSGEPSDVWSETDGGSDRNSFIFRRRDTDSRSENSRPGSSDSKYPDARLSKYLMADIQKDQPRDLRSDISPSPPLTPNSISTTHSPPMPTPPNARRPGLVDQFMNEKINNDNTPRRRPSSHTGRVLRASENSPQRDLFLLRVQADQAKRARIDAEKREQRANEALEREELNRREEMGYAVENPQRDAKEGDTLCTDIPWPTSISTKVLQHHDPEASSASPGLVIDTQRGRKLSSPLSPLRKMSWPGDADESSAEGGS